MSGQKRISDEDRAKIKQLNKNGMSFVALAKEYGVTYQTISRICNPEKYKIQLEKNRQYAITNKEAVLNTRKRNQRRFSIVFTKSIDTEIIKHLETKENINDYIRTLILKDMAQNNGHA